jgi:hypothetical protein
MKCQKDAVRGNVLDAKCLHVACGFVNQDKYVSEPTNQNTVTKCNIHMDGVKLAIFGSIEITTSICGWNSGI